MALSSVCCCRSSKLSPFVLKLYASRLDSCCYFLLLPDKLDTSAHLQGSNLTEPAGLRTVEASDQDQDKGLQMEKEAEYQGWSPRPLQHDKRKTVRKEVCAKSACPRRQGHKMYQMTLEKDIAKLQRQLKLEVDTHRTLERALTRTLGALPRFSPGLTTEVQKLVAEVAVLEEEVVHLEEYLTILHQGLLHNDALHNEIVPKLSEIFAEGQPATVPAPSTLTTVKRSSIIASLLPSTVDNMRAKPVFLGGSPIYGQLKQKLSRSSSFRRESSNVRSIHGTCYG
ncbi:hypothetical protein L7F22_042724 [Adiantum nelumboides]|nr:hypothetical protein [Adiantum nelumboides]